MLGALSAEAAHAIRSGGGEPLGLHPGHRQLPALAYFYDPHTCTILAILLADITTDAVKSHLQDSRKLFRNSIEKALNDDANPGTASHWVSSGKGNPRQPCS